MCLARNYSLSDFWLAWVLQDTDEMFDTDVYVYCSQSDVYGEWNYESFRAEHLEVGLRRAQVASDVACVRVQ